MTPFWEYKFTDSEEFIETFDELPLWSAYFGLMLLKHVDLRRGISVLDIGSGAGFPLLEMAGRLGTSCKCYGLDPWINANQRALKKTRNYGITNAEILEGTAESIPFGEGSLDLIVSNLGINNFDDPPAVFKECFRALKKGGKLALTTNLDGHWKEFYQVFEEVARKHGRTEIVKKLSEQQIHRGSVESISRLFTDAGFSLSRHFEDSFDMRFLDGTAFLNHHFIKLGWLGSWKEIIPEDEWPVIFPALENELNLFAAKARELTLTVPMAYIEGEKL
jgi:arsenite methyltransferase